MGANAIVHVIGTGTIGEPLIGMLASLTAELGLEEVTFHKRTPLLTDRSKVLSLMRKGAKLCVDDDAAKGFQDLGMEPTFETVEAINRAAVIIDCTPSGVGTQNKTEYYEKFTSNTLGFIGFGKPYARGVNDNALIQGQDQYIQVVSCNTHNLSILIQTLALADGGPDNLIDGRFVCMRRANDISQDSSFAPSPQVGRHNDVRFGTHHARDAWHLFQTLGYDLNLFSTAIKLNTQYMHTIFFDIRVKNETNIDDLIRRIQENDRMSVTYKTSKTKRYWAIASPRKTATRCCPRSPRRCGTSTPEITRSACSACGRSSTTRSSLDFSQGSELRSWRCRQVGALRVASAAGVLDGTSRTRSARTPGFTEDSSLQPWVHELCGLEVRPSRSAAHEPALILLTSAVSVGKTSNRSPTMP
jgi:glyceraldehyde-3-phosphate dehydrogenase (NAD(P))